MFPATACVAWLLCAGTAFAQSELVPDGLGGSSTGSASGVVRLQALGGDGSDLRFRHIAGGQAVGFQSDITHIELFTPYWADDLNLMFVDGRMGITNDGTWLANAGLGWRRMSDDESYYWGGSFWYDFDARNQEANFQQFGTSVEFWSPLVDGRANFYVPIFGRDKQIGPSIFTDPYFQGNNVQFSSLTPTMIAMDGGDVEVGAAIPGLQRFNTRLYGGYYYFDSPLTDEVSGFRGRLQAAITPDLVGQVIVQNDKLYDTSVVFSLAWTLPIGRRSAVDPISSASTRNAMRQQVERNNQVVVQGVVIEKDYIATDPATNAPYRFIHVDSAAAPGGTGTFEDPFSSLSVAEVAALQRNIIFAWADSNFIGEDITLKLGQRFLGEGVDHSLTDVVRGTFLLPRATAGTNVPIISNSVGAAITAAQNTEISGFTINTPGTGVFGTSFTGDVNVNRVTINNAVNQGMYFNDIAGDISVTDVAIVGSAGTGISLEGNIDSVTYTGGSISGTAGAAVDIFDTNGNFTFDGVAISQVGGRVIRIDSAHSGNIDFSTSTITNNAGSGILVQNSAVDLSFDNPNITNATGNAITLLNNTGEYTLSNLNLTTAGSTGLLVNNSGSVTVDGTSNIQATGGPAVNAQATDIDMTFASLSSTGSTATGIRLQNVDGMFTVTGSTTIDNSATHGISIAASTIDADFATVDISGAGGGLVGDGVRLDTNANSTFNFDVLNVTTDNGSGLFARNSTDVTVGGGTISATGGPAVDVRTTGGLDETLIDMTFSSLSSTNSTTTGINLDGIEGDFTVTGATTITNPTGTGVRLANIPDNSTIVGSTIIDRSSDVTFGDVTINSRNAAGSDIGAAEGT